MIPGDGTSLRAPVAAEHDTVTDPVVRLLRRVLAVAFVAFVASVALPGGGLGVIIFNGLNLALQLAAAVLAWAVFVRTGHGHRQFLLVAAALTCFTAGNVYIYIASAMSVTVFPSPADYGFLLFYPLLLGALVTAVRREVQGSTALIWLDSAIGALGAASVVSVVLGPTIVDAVAGGSISLATVIAVAYPVFDLLLIAAVVGVVSLRGLRVDRRWLALVAGLLVFTATDFWYAHQLADGSYQIGALVDVGWAVGMAFISLWADVPHQVPSPSATPTRLHNRLTLAAPLTASVAGIAVIAAGTQVAMSVVAVALATLTLLAAVGRTSLSFQALLRLADLRRQATTDDLTGLPNRRHLYENVPPRLARGGHQALLLLDLDRFKEVNDSLGHAAGDELLVYVGRRLAGQLRQGDLLARLGGDEFAVLLGGADEEDAVRAAVRLREALAAPFVISDISLHTDASIGVALYPEHGQELGMLLRRADIAMYKAKRARVGHRVFTGMDGAEGDSRFRLLDELRTALREDQLVLHYQPKVHLATGEVDSVEALVRWDHPTQGLLYPDAFLGLAEDSGLMEPLTRVVLEQALDQVSAWRAGGRSLSVAVNLSASSIVDTTLPDQIGTLLASRALPPDVLQLEITEEFLMIDRDRARSTLERLRGTGIRISVDDFGTGYSSLSYLRDLPIDELKLDRSFIFPMANDARAAALVASTIDLAHSLGLQMVAEGVEDKVAYAELARRGCDQAQGYFMSRPLPAVALEMWLDERSAAPVMSAR